MKTRLTIALSTFGFAVLLAALTTPAEAKFHARAYVRPVVQYTMLANQDSGYYDQKISSDAQTGWGIGAGVLLGEMERFELGAEISRVQFDGQAWVGYDYPTRTNLYAKSDYQVTPFLVTFRYYFRDKDVFIRPFIGTFLGVYDFESSWSNHSETGIGFSVGLGAGVSFRLGDSVSLDVGYRYIDSSEASDLWFGCGFYYTAQIVNLGLNVRF